jgi:hypothetical protein
MRPIVRRMAGASAFAFLFAASMTGAQEPQSIRIRGTIENVDGLNLNIKARDGNTSKSSSAITPALPPWSRQRSPTSSQDRLSG